LLNTLLGDDPRNGLTALSTCVSAPGVMVPMVLLKLSSLLRARLTDRLIPNRLLLLCAGRGLLAWALTRATGLLLLAGPGRPNCAGERSMKIGWSVWAGFGATLGVGAPAMLNGIVCKAAVFSSGGQLQSDPGPQRCTAWADLFGDCGTNSTVCPRMPGIGIGATFRAGVGAAGRVLSALRVLVALRWSRRCTERFPEVCCICRIMAMRTGSLPRPRSLISFSSVLGYDGRS
jgi:hypothetical protein